MAFALRYGPRWADVISRARLVTREGEVFGQLSVGRVS